MVVECSTCHAKYNVDDKKIPAAGVKVRCHKCQNVILIKKPEPVLEIITPPEPVIQPKSEIPPYAEPKVAPPEPETPPPDIAPPEVTPPSPGITPSTIIPKKPEAEKLQIETTAQAPTPSPAISDEDKKWHERARRLAKALASDLVLYNQDKVERGLREGTLVQLLGSEIRRSWEYYCQQIPKYIVESTDYFKEQLNKVVGKGKELFK